MAKYPECEKYAEGRKEREVVLFFFEWLEEQGFELCRFEGSERLATRCLKKTEVLLAEYQGTDLKELEEERRSMLEESGKEN